jgi:carboxyl-terminal processing protease
MPANSDSELRVVEIIRDEVKLKDSEAKGELIEWGKPGETPRKLGIVILPSFYGDMDRNGNPNAKSTTRDVLAIVERLKKEGAEGIVMDLRRNGGGFLDEAVNLTGLFIKKGPVVQVKSYNGEMNVLKDRNSDIAYDGPLVVLVNRGSASASEIFAGAMQDYRRAVVVGDSHTFGKGTVQQMVELSRVMPFSQNAADAGAVKLTIQKFYRAAGGSTQLMGVESDIVIPSLSDQKQNGEDSLKGPLEYDVVPAQEFDVWSRALHVDDLKKLSSERIGKSAEFGFVREDLERIKTRIEENTRSLNEAKRKSELDEDKARRSKRLALRDANTDSKIGKTFKLTLDTIKEDVLPLWTPDESSRAALMDMEDEDEDEVVKKEKEAAKAKKNVPPYDPVKEEALSILSDLIRLDVTGETVQFKRK